MMRKRRTKIIWGCTCSIFLLFFVGCTDNGDNANTAPMPTAPALITIANTPGTVQIAPGDLNTGQTFTFVVTMPPVNGQATVNAQGIATYTPNAGFTGTDRFEVTVTDNGSPPLSGTVTIDVTVNPAPVTVTGVASKGPLLNCTIQMFLLLSDGRRGGLVAGEPITAAIMTQPPDGSWSATIPGDQPGPFTVEVGGPDCTYFDEATGTQQSTGGTPILGLLPAGETRVAITPLTHALVLAVQSALAQASEAGDTTNPTVTVNNVIANATAAFGFDPVRTLPPDPRNLPAATVDNTDQLEYAAVLGGLSQVLHASLSTESAVELVSLAQDLTDGVLDGATALPEVPTTAIHLLQEAQGAGLTGTNLEEVANNFVSDPPDVPGLDRDGFQEAASTAPVTTEPLPEGGLAATLASAPHPLAAAISTFQETTASTVVSPGSSAAPHAFHITTSPLNGMVEIHRRAETDDAILTYRPHAGFTGGDQLVVTVTNSATPPLSGSVSIDITVLSSTTPPSASLSPTASPAVITVGANQTGTSQVSPNDPNPPHTFAVSEPLPAHGSTVVDAAGVVRYTPNADFVGQDAVVVAVTNSQSVSGTVSISITVVNDPPQAVADTATTEQNTPVTVNVSANDTDLNRDTLVVTEVTSGTSGTAVVNSDNTVTYTPNPGVSGIDTFTYTISDGKGGTATATVTVTINPAHGSPPAVASCEASTAEVFANEVTILSVAASDPGGGLLTFAWTQTTPAAPSGTFSPPNAAASDFLAPAVDADTPFTLEVTVTNNQGSSTCMVQVTVRTTVIFRLDISMLDDPSQRLQ